MDSRRGNIVYESRTIPIAMGVSINMNALVDLQVPSQFHCHFLFYCPSDLHGGHSVGRSVGRSMVVVVIGDVSLDQCLVQLFIRIQHSIRTPRLVSTHSLTH